MDMKEKISEIVEKIQKDDDLKKQFAKDPIKAVEGLIGVDLPDDMIEKVIDGVKAKITIDSVSDIAGAFKKLF